MRLQKRGNFDTHIVVGGLLILAILKFESGNTVKSTISNLKEEELKAVVRRWSLELMFLKISQIS